MGQKLGKKVKYFRQRDCTGEHLKNIKKEHCCRAQTTEYAAIAAFNMVNAIESDHVYSTRIITSIRQQDKNPQECGFIGSTRHSSIENNTKEARLCSFNR